MAGAETHVQYVEHLACAGRGEAKMLRLGESSGERTPQGNEWEDYRKSSPSSAAPAAVRAEAVVAADRGTELGRARTKRRAGQSATVLVVFTREV